METSEIEKYDQNKMDATTLESSHEDLPFGEPSVLQQTETFDQSSGDES